MKKITISLLFMIASFPFLFGQQAASTVPMVDGMVNYNEVVTVEGVKKDVLYGRAKLWFANAAKSANNVIQLDDKDNGVVLGKATYEAGDELYSHTWSFTTKIQLRDEKYKVEFYDIQRKRIYRLSASAIPTVQDLTTVFNHPNRFKKDGSLKEDFKKLASEADLVFNGFLANVKKAMTEKASDF